MCDMSVFIFNFSPQVLCCNVLLIKFTTRNKLLLPRLKVYGSVHFFFILIVWPLLRVWLGLLVLLQQQAFVVVFLLFSLQPLLGGTKTSRAIQVILEPHKGRATLEPLVPQMDLAFLEPLLQY